MKKHDIYIKSGTDYKQITKDLLELCDLEGIVGDKEKHIGIKPNLVSPTPADFGGTTHPEVVAGIVEYLQEHDFDNLCILESSWVGGRTEEAFEYCGYRTLSERYQVPLLDMQKERGIAMPCMNVAQNSDVSPGVIRICAYVKNLDFLINVPVLKGHCQTKMTCALKNMKGLIPNAEKRRFHTEGLHRPIACLNQIIRQDFIVVDNICGDLDFEDGGNPCVMNRVLAARDPVLLDAWLCHEMHYEVKEIPYITMAGDLGVGESDYTKAEIHYLDAGADRAIPRSRKIVELQDYVEDIDSCSACYGNLIPALERLRMEGMLETESDRIPSFSRICIGQGYRGKTGELGIGSCTGKFCRSLPGCPPTETQIYDFLKAILDGTR